jgi:hypothetical protein
MTDQDVERWKKLVADFETSDLTQREFASERGISFSNLRLGSGRDVKMPRAQPPRSF